VKNEEQRIGNQIVNGSANNIWSYPSLVLAMRAETSKENGDENSGAKRGITRE
jgi:hypothetical protein